MNSFPAISETFILNQIIGLLQRGHDVEIYASRPVDSPTAFHAAVERFELLSRTQYCDALPAAFPAVKKDKAQRFLKWGRRLYRRVFNRMKTLAQAPQNNAGPRKTLLPQRIAGNYDIIHCHYGPNGQRAVAFRKAGLLKGPIVTSFHGYDANMLPGIYGPQLYEELFKHGELFTVGSEFMRRRLIALGAPEERIAKLPMGVDVSRFRFVERTKSDNGEFKLLTIARLVEVKGIEYALRAVSIARQHCPHLRYLIAGDGPLRGQLEELTIELGLAQTVEFLGAVSQEEVPRLHQTAQAFLLPSIVTESGEEENQPVVLAEAQASGLPVIASAIGGVPESLLDGQSGLLVSQRNPEALASAILWLCDHPEIWSPMGRVGRTFVEERFNLEKLHDQLVSLYKSFSPQG